MRENQIEVYIVGDEPTICTAYARLIRSAEMMPHTFASVEDLVHAQPLAEGACVICDVQKRGADGLELPALLARAGHRIPVIFVTAHDTPEARELAQMAGGAAYLRKPVDAQALLDTIEWAVSEKRHSPHPNPFTGT
jgi:FixJ family two-component response regulator